VPRQPSAGRTRYRRIAAQLYRPVSTVWRWIRAGRDPAHVEWLRTEAMEWIAGVDRDVITTLAPEPTRLGEALTALGAALGRPAGLYRPTRAGCAPAARWFGWSRREIGSAGVVQVAGYPVGG